MRRGAKDYLPKPVTPAQIAVLVERTAARRALERRLTVLEARVDAGAPAVPLEVRSPSMQQALRLLDHAARHDVPVLLRGESGTGKQLLAQELHARSARSDRGLAVVRCAAIPDDALVRVLWGSARGAAPGGARAQGAVETAEGGTLVLGEIGEASLDAQARLLRLLQDGEYERGGDARVRTADVRVVATTSRDLEADVKEGRFRPELLYALAVMEIHVPPLRARHEDLLPLARHLLAELARKANRAAPALSPEAERALAAYAWPGNVRELRNSVERALIVTRGAEIELEALPERIAAPSGGAATIGGDFTAEEVEREHVLRVLARSQRLEDASRILGIDVTTLWRKRKRWGR
jgi:NtrC-family two-component system response regulator AlgB